VHMVAGENGVRVAGGIAVAVLDCLVHVVHHSDTDDGA
jgi:hypothetical protein